MSFEKKTEQLNSKLWHRCLPHNSSLARIVQIEHAWLRYLQRGGGPKKRFQYCLDLDSAETLLCLRTIQGHSGGNQIDPALQDNVLLLSDFAEYIYHVGSSPRHAFHHPIRIDSGQKRCQESEADVFLHSRESHVHTSAQAAGLRRHETQSCGLQTKLENTSENSVLANLRVAQKKGLTFHQTRSNAIILHNSLPTACIEKVVVMNSEEVLHHKMYESPGSPRKVVLKPVCPNFLSPLLSSFPDRS